MSQKQGSSKSSRRDFHAGRSRGTLIKTGRRGARRTRLSEMELMRMGKGSIRNVKPASGPAWKGVEKVIFGSYDMEQARKNVELGFCTKD